jgi:hypothetical protein
MTDRPDDVPGASDAARELQQRNDAAKILVHVLTGDSWGIQDVILQEPSVGALGTFPLFWQAGFLLRTYLTDDERARLIERLRQEIVDQRLVEEGRDNGD